MKDPVREARQRLIEAGLLAELPDSPAVPELIMRSWRRSVGQKIDSSGPIRGFDEITSESLLAKAAEPVLDRWQSQLADTSATLFLSDRGGNIISRRVGSPAVRRRLDAMNAAEGFDYSEDSIGTNGLGTSIIERSPVLIRGAQHFNDGLADLACAAVPVMAPGGSVIGAVSLGGPVDSSSPLMLSLTREIGVQIEDRLRESSRPEDLALAMSFMRYSNSQRPTVVVDQETILANTPALPYVSVSTHVLLWELLSAHAWDREPAARLELPGTGAGVVARRGNDGPRDYYVVHFHESEAAPSAPGAPRSVPSGAAAVSVGRRLTGGDRVDEPEPRSTLLVAGPRGSGRSTVSRALREGAGGTGAIHSVTVGQDSAPDWVSITEALGSGQDVLIRRLEELTEGDARKLLAVIEGHRELVRSGTRSTVLLMTASREGSAPTVRTIIDKIGVDERTKALSEMPERVPGLVTAVLDRVDSGGRHTLSPTALQSLVNWDWPGNLTELNETVSELVRGAPTVIERKHLPPHLQRLSTRRLTLIQQAERDAIIDALDSTGGNKSEAAAMLGIGRTTLYRRLRYFGLDAAERSL